MKKYSILLAAAAIIAATSCAKEALAPEENAAGEKEQTVTEQALTNPVTITFTANATQTKVSLEDEGTAGSKTAVWDDGDQVKVIWYNEDESAMKSTTVTVDSYGDASTTFTATVEDADYYYAVYPASIDATLDGEGNFSVSFPNSAQAPTSFAGAAWYAAKTTKAAKEFAFHPISTVIKFTLDGSAVANPNQIYFRSMNGGLNRLHGHAAVTFAADNTLTAAPDPNATTPYDGAGNVTYNVSGEGTYYIPLPGYGAGYTYSAKNETSPGTSGTDGFILWIKKSGENYPAAYYSGTITQQPGKFYNIKSAVDSKIITDYYVATSGQGTGDGLSQANAATLSDLKTNVPAFKYSGNIAGALLLNGTTINFLSGTYSEPLGPFNTNDYASAHSYTIKGGIGGTTTFTTSASSLFDETKPTITIKDITFDGCTTEPAVKVSAGKVTLDNVDFTSCAAKAIDVTGGTFTYNNGDVSNCSAASAIVISNDPTVSLNKVTLSGNNDGAAKINGAALRIAPSSTASVNLDNCLFIENKAGAGVGGAIYHNGTSANLELKDCKFISNSCTGNSGGAISAANTVTGHIYITGCLFYGNTTGTQYGSAIHCANKKTSEQVFLGVNNSLFYNNGSVQGTNKADGNSTLVICGKHVIMNSTLIATSNIIIRTGYNNGEEAAHTNYGGSLLLNNVISNESTNAVHSALNTINTKYTLRCNGYNYYSSKNNQVQVSTQDVQFALNKDTDYTWDPSAYTWTWTPSAAQKTGMASYNTLYSLVNNDQYNDANSPVHDDAVAFLTWLESLEYEYSSTKYNAFQVDINGRPRNTSAYWPGCYQND